MEILAVGSIYLNSCLGLLLQNGYSFLILGNREFRILWSANLCSMLGSQVSRIGILLFLYQRRHSATEVATMLVLDGVPGTLFAPLAGLLIDRVSNRALLLVTDALRASLLIWLAITPTLTGMYCTIVLQALANALYEPTRMSLLALLLTDDKLPAANGYDQAALNSSLIVGPMLGASIFTGAGVRAVLGVDALSFVLSFLLLSRLAVPPLTHSIKTGSLSFNGIRAGWRYLQQHAIALPIYSYFFAGVLCTGIWTPLAPMFIHDHLKGSDQLLGEQLGALGAGAIMGSVAAPLLLRRAGKGQIFVTGLIGEGACICVYALVANRLLSILMCFIWGSVVATITVPLYSLLQSVIDETFLGRMFSTLRQVEGVALIIAAVSGAILATHFDTQKILLAAGLLYSIFTAVFTLSKGGRVVLSTR